jgi:hypothetical protein
LVFGRQILEGLNMCKQEYDTMKEALKKYGRDSYQYKDSLDTFLASYAKFDEVRESYRVDLDDLLYRLQEEISEAREQIARGKESYGASWDDFLYNLQEEIREAREELASKLNIPPRPTWGVQSSKIRSKIFEKKETAMVFSRKLDEAFNQTGIKLGDDETYVCCVCVVQKPHYVSEALATDPLGQNIKGAPRANYILEPAVMEPVMNILEQDKIDY